MLWRFLANYPKGRFGPVNATVVFSLPPSAFPEEHLAFKSGRPIYAIVMLVLSSLFMCATFFPLLYSIVVPNEDLEGVVSALEERGAPSLESETVVQQAIDAAGPLRRAIKVGYYSGATKSIHLDGSHTPETINPSQATYIAWFQKRPKPILVAITRYANDEGQKAYGISEVDSVSIVRAYAVPVLLFGVSLFLARNRKSSTTAS